MTKRWQCDGCGGTYDEVMPLEDCVCGCTSWSFIGKSEPSQNDNGHGPQVSWAEYQREKRSGRGWMGARSQFDTED